MENREKAFWQMQNNCLTFCIENKIQWKDYPVINTLVNLLESNSNQLIMALKALETNDPQGKSKNKDAQLNLFSEKIYRLSRKITLFAKMTGNELLLSEVDISESSLFSYSEDKLLRIYTNILNLANRHIKHLKEYSITTSEVDSLRLELNNLKHIYISKNHLFNKRISTPKSVKELIIESTKILDRLDDAFEGLIKDDKFKQKWLKLRRSKVSPILKQINKSKKTDNIDFNYYG